MLDPLLSERYRRRAIGATPIEKIFIDGGFADNDIFVKLAARYFAGQKLRTMQSPLGSTLVAALAVADKPAKPKFLKTNYAMRKHQP